MKAENAHEDEMAPEYAFRSEVRGKCLEAYRGATATVVLEPDVAAPFPNAASENEALRSLIDDPDEPTTED